MINIQEEIKKGQYLFPNTIEEIKLMNGEEFENFLFWYYKKCGYKTIKTSRTNDNGIDLIVSFYGEELNREMNIGIQAKRWTNPIPKKEIVKMSEGKDYYKLDYLWLISTSRLTSEAYLYASNHDINVKTTNEIQEILDDLKTMDNIKFTRAIKIQKEENTKIELTEEDLELYKALKIYRYNKAKEENIPKYLIFKNQTLKELSFYKPKDMKSLKAINGIGDNKIKKYSEDILSIINSFLYEK